MKIKFTALLCALFLLCGSGLMTAAAEDNLKISVETSNAGKNADITIEGVAAPTYGAQLTLKTDLKASELTFTSAKSGAYSVVKDGADSGTVTLYLDATQLLNSGDKLALGKLQANQKLSISSTAELILVDRSLIGTEYQNVAVSVTEKKTSSGSGGGSNNRGDNSGTVITPSASPSPTPSAAEKFTDIETHWAKDAVSFVAKQGLFQGMSDTEFMPDENMTRAMFVTVLQRFGTAVDAKWALQSDTGMNFTDVSDSDWYADAVTWASGTGVVNGMEDGTFAPNNAITREQMAVMIVRFANLCGVELPTSVEPYNFTDAAQIQPWATDAVALAQQAGIIQGRPEGNFDPQATATRAEVATIMQRLVEKTK